MTCSKMGSDESHFNVSLMVWNKVTRLVSLFGRSFARHVKRRIVSEEVLAGSRSQEVGVGVGDYN